VAAFALNAGPRWEVISATGPAPIVVNDLLIPPRQAEALTRVLQPGAHVHVPVGDELMVLGRGALALDLTPGTDLVLPGVPGRWFGRQAHARLATGEVRVTTGARFHGARLAIATPEAQVEVHGTTLAVIREPLGTCVCVLEGTVMVGRSMRTMAPVAHGHLHYIFTDGHQKTDAMRPNERVQLALFRAARADAMAP
ncbi:MAG TPA: FecR domain-containing protein, partial [Candidatus Eisenbacteria bacterium]|nr:FecR domain-containing protein [Candidatus Eisenbacteria bacterium]